MKTLKITLVLLLTTLFFSSCVIVEDDYEYNNVSLNEVLQSTDLWYIDYNKTTGYGDTRFMSLAFTISFERGKIYANNNLVGIGSVGDGYGDVIGFYQTNGDVLRIDHDIDGIIEFEVYQMNNGDIKLSDLDRNVTYTLVPYSVDNFDYDKIFNDNIEYFLQEYEAWEKSGTYNGEENPFDNENYLAFIPENVSVFNSSQDEVGIALNELIWDFTGEYKIFDVQGTDTLKVLSLYYDNDDIEEFELKVLTDGKIQLYHISSETYYEFIGLNNIIYKKGEVSSNKSPRKRFIVKRKTKKVQKHIAKNKSNKR